MRFIQRTPISARSQRYLDSWTAKIEAASDPRKESERLWYQKGSTMTIQEVRATLEQMNGGLSQRCMYCEYNEAGHIDHFKPRATHPAATFRWLNYLLACDICNSKKRDRFLGERGEVPINPTVDDPSSHIEFLPSGAVSSHTDRGAWSIKLFGLQRAVVTDYRRDMWTFIESAVVMYAHYQRKGDLRRAEKTERALKSCPCPTVFRRFLEISRTPSDRFFLASECRAALVKHPEIYHWIEGALL